MKIIEVIAEAGSLGSYADDAVTGVRNIGTSMLRGIGTVFGRGSRFRKAEELAPEIEALTRTKGRPLTRDEIAKHISNSHPGVADEIADAVKVKQEQLDFDYQQALDAWNRKPARSRTAATKPRPAPAARLTSAEETAIRSKPEYQPDPNLVKDVESKANSLISKANRAEAVKNLAPVAKWTKIIVELGIDVALASQIIAPFTEYYAKLGDATEYWNARKIGPGAPASIKTPEEWYVWYTDKALGDAILKSGTIFIAAVLAKTVSWAFLSGPAKKWGAEKLSKVLAAGSTLGIAAIIQHFFTAENNAWWGSFFANALSILPVDIDGDVSRMVGGAINRNIPTMAQRMVSIGFRLPTAIAEWFRSFTGMETGADEFAKPADQKGDSTSGASGASGAAVANGQPAVANGQPAVANGTAADAPAVATGTAADAPAVAATDKKAAQQGFTDLGGGWLKDPATGKIYPKIQESR